MKEQPKQVFDYDFYLQNTDKAAWAYPYAKGLNTIFFRLFFGRRVFGLENVPPKSGYLICANHVSYLDPTCIGSSFPYPIYYVARHTLFVHFFLRWLLPMMNAIPIDRDRPDIASMRTVLRVLKAGAPVLIFPEGTRSLGGQLQRGEKGVGLLMAKSHAPVLPVRIRGTYEALPSGGSLKFHPITVTIGKIMPPFEVPKGMEKEDAYQLFSDTVMAEIEKL